MGLDSEQSYTASLNASTKTFFRYPLVAATLRDMMSKSPPDLMQK